MVVASTESRSSMTEILSAIGGAIVELRVAYEDEVAVEHRTFKQSASSRQAKEASGTQTVALRGALRALRRAGCDVTQGAGAKWCRARHADENTMRFTFSAYVRLYYDLTRSLRWARPLPQDGAPTGGPAPRRGEAASEILRLVVDEPGGLAKQLVGGGSSKGSPINATGLERTLLSTLMRAPVHLENIEAPAKSPTGRAARELRQENGGEEAEVVAPNPHRSSLVASIREAFAKFDLYGDPDLPGEVVWADVPRCFKALGVDLTPEDLTSLARQVDVAPKYPCDYVTFQRLVAADHDRRRAKVLASQDDDRFDRNADAAKRHRAAQRGAAEQRRQEEALKEDGAITATDGTKPMMAHDLIEIRRAAIRRTRRNLYG